MKLIVLSLLTIATGSTAGGFQAQHQASHPIPRTLESWPAIHKRSNVQSSAYLRQQLIRRAYGTKSSASRQQSSSQASKAPTPAKPSKGQASSSQAPPKKADGLPISKGQHGSSSSLYSMVDHGSDAETKSQKQARVDGQWEKLERDPAQRVRPRRQKGVLGKAQSLATNLWAGRPGKAQSPGATQRPSSPQSSYTANTLSMSATSSQDLDGFHTPKSSGSQSPTEPGSPREPKEFVPMG